MANKNKALGTALEGRVVDRARGKGLNSHKQPGSGVYKDFPSDVVIERVLVECKVRTAQIDAKGQRYIKLDLDWKAKVDEQAGTAGYEAGIVVVNAKGSTQPQAIVSLDFLLSLLYGRKSGDQFKDDINELTEQFLDHGDGAVVTRVLHRGAGQLLGQ